MRPNSVRAFKIRQRSWNWVIGFFVAAATLVSGAAQQSAQAEPGFPNRPIKIIVPYGPGGVGDFTMRLVAEKLTDKFGKQVIIENRPGAGGIVAAKALKSSPADGYTLSVTGNGMAISQTLFKSLPYDALKDFTAVSVTASFEMLLFTKTDSPYKTIQDVIAAAKKNPGKLNLGTIRPGSTQNLSAELFRQMTGIKVALVTYKTTPELLTAVLQGDIALAFDYYAALAGAITDKQIKILATSDEERNELLPGVPTVKESGLPDYIVTSWNALSAPAGLPNDVLMVLNKAIVESLAAPDFQQKAKKFGLTARGSTPQAMRARMERDIKRWGNVIETANIPKM
jgi:tripartite-type tricarboxylate transporter receptor subunit TctC